MATKSYHSRVGVGAMTAAMQAARGVEGARVLRIGVTEGARVIDERIVRTRAAVSVGTTERSTLALPPGEGRPAYHELFTVGRDGAYALNFTDAMEGRVVLASGVRTLAEIRAAGTARRAHGAWQLPLTEQSRGKVSIAGATVLFQFVAAPPAVPRPQLPTAIRANPVKNLDWAFNACLAFFVTTAFGAVSYVEYLYDPEVEDAFVLSGPMVRDLIPPTLPAPVLPPETREAAEVRAEPTTAPSETAATTPRPSATRPSTTPSRPGTDDDNQASTERRIAQATAAAEHAADVAQRALAAQFAAITSPFGSGRSAVDRVQNGVPPGDQTLAALERTSGIANASGAVMQRRGLSASSVPGGGRLGYGTAARGGNQPIAVTGVVEVAPRGQVSLGRIEEPLGEGTIQSESIGQTIRRNIGGIQNCYTQALRNNASLRGRIEMRFTIGTSGRVVGTPSASGMADAPQVGRCIAERVRSIAFPPPTGGSVEAEIPFGFAPGAS